MAGLADPDHDHLAPGIHGSADGFHREGERIVEPLAQALQFTDLQIEDTAGFV
ncbi:MAG: hypothetical protein QM796_04005 [Chthoniobacteraceae bacterium]